MYKARLTKEGAWRLGHPKLAGETIEYDAIVPPGVCVGNVFYKGQRLGSVLSFSGDEPGAELLTKPEE